MAFDQPSVGNKDSKQTGSEHCWNSIGVWSNNAPRCEKLKQVIHCRNCDVYANAGRDLFEQSISTDTIIQWTKNVAEVEIDSNSKRESIIIFRLAKEWFSLPTKCFDEIARHKMVHSIPHYKGKIVAGITNVRGELKLCFSLQALLGLVGEGIINAGQNEYNRKLVVTIDDDIFVFPVDEISGVYRYNISDMVDVPATTRLETKDLIQGILELPGKQVSCMDPYRLRAVIEGSMNE